MAREFKVSEMTIRRDLDALEGQAHILRTHGGAVLTEKMILEFDYRDRRETNGASKLAIAAEARKLVKSGQRLILDTGTTALELATLLKDGLKLTGSLADVDVFITSAGAPEDALRRFAELGPEVIIAPWA